MQVENLKHADISVIIPMYNVENLIAETITSLKENYSNIEFLLIDDGSTDQTIEQAKQAIENDARFIIFSKSNSGVSDTRNFGIEKAKGEFILFMDSDDLMAPFAIDHLYQAAIEHNADYVYGGIKKFNSTKEWTIPVHDKNNIFSLGVKEILINTELFTSMGPVAKLMHHSLIKNNYFPTEIQCAEDQFVIFNALLQANKIFCIGEYIYSYRERDISINQQSITQQRDEMAFIYFNDILKVLGMIRWSLEKSPMLPVEQKIILRAYNERAFQFDVYPLLIKVLKFDKKNAAKVFLLLTQLIHDISDEEINFIAGYRYFLMRSLIDNIDYIPISAFPAYRKMLITLFNKLNEKTKATCAKPTVWGQRWLDNYYLVTSNFIQSFTYFLYLRVQKKTNRWLNKNGANLIKNHIFPLLTELPIEQNKIVFATTSKGKASKNFEYLMNELKRDGKKYNIKKYLGTASTFRRKLLRYYHLATAETIFLESYYSPLYGVKPNHETQVVQVWHACGAYKKFAHAALNMNESNTKEFETRAHQYYTHILASSEEVGKCYAEAFNADAEKIFNLGVPRTDFFFDSKKIQKAKVAILKKYPQLNNHVNILYSPTFRGSPTERNRFKLPFDWSILDQIPKNYRLIIKLHPVVNIQNIQVPPLYENRVLILDSKEDINEWLIICDILIADYSSLIFEYALLNKPIIYYAYDLKNYFDERGFFYHFNDYIYGEVVQNQDALVHAIINAQNVKYKFSEKRWNFINKFMNSCDGKSSKRIIDALIRKNNI